MKYVNTRINVGNQYPTSGRGNYRSDSLEISHELGLRRNRSQNTEHGIHTSASRDEDFPEGGRTAWVSLTGCFCAWMASYGLMNTVGTFQAYLQTHQLSAYTEAEVGWIFGLYLFMTYCCGVQVGPIFDAIGPRALIAAGSVCQIASLFLLGACSSKGSIIYPFKISHPRHGH